MANKYLKVNLKSVVKITPFDNRIEITHISGFVRVVWPDTQVIYYRKASKRQKIAYIDMNYDSIDLFSDKDKI